MKAAIRIVSLTAMILCAASAFAKDKPQDPPTVSDAHKAAFFKAQVEMKDAQPAMQKAQTDFQKAIADLTADCGKDFAPQLDTNGDPSCVVKPPEKPKPAPDPAPTGQK